jgi:DNA-directed RNA polymerase specialized sigma24 family protein
VVSADLRLIALHERFLQGEEPLSEELAQSLLPVLHTRLRSTFPSSDDDTAHDAAVDALVEYFRRPNRFDPARGIPLDRFLYMVARRRLLNRLRNASARIRRESDYAVSSPLIVLQPDLSETRETFGLIIAEASNDSERAALRCWLSGGHHTAMAAELGLAHLTETAQQLEVKRFKDRIRARLRRRGRLPRRLHSAEVAQRQSAGNI